MTDGITILVIILSLTLAVFLVTAIVLVIYLIRVARRINELADDASKTSQTINAAVRNVINLTSPIVVAKQLKKVINKFNNSKKESQDDEE